MEYISRVLVETTATHVVNQHGEIVSMQIDPGNPIAGLKPFFEGRMVSSEFDVSISLDSLGLRKRIEIDGDTVGEPVHITLLGDSFMFGWGVEFSKSFAAHLGKYLSGFLKQRVIVSTLGVPGTGQFSQLSLLNRIPHPQPDIILLGMYVTEQVASGNDLIENLTECYKLKPSLGTPTNENEISHPDFFRRTRRWLKNHSNLFRLVEIKVGAILLARFNHAINIESDAKVFEQAWAVTDSALMILQQAAKEEGALFAIQYIPNMLDVARNNRKTYTRLERICNVRNIALAPNPIDLFKFSRAENGLDIGAFYYIGDGHWTDRAHLITARQTAEFLMERLTSKF